MPTVIFTLLNLVVIASSFILVYRILGIQNFIDSLICWFSFYFSQVILTELILGSLGLLYLKNIILLNLAVFLSILFFARNRPCVFCMTKIKSAFSSLLENKPACYAACLILGFVLVKVFVNLVNPSFGWDSLNYHFTFPVEWLKHGNLDNPIVVSDDPFPSYYPIDGSLFFFWLILPFKNAYLADLAQLPFFILSFLSVFAISRRLRINKELSFFGACLFVFIPNFFKQLQIGYVDIMVAGVFLAALNSLFMLRERIEVKNCFIFSLLIGMLIGIKTTAVSYSIFLILPFLCILFSYKPSSLLRKYGYFILFVCVVFIVGGFSYLRNFILISNPFYPLDLAISGLSIFKGVIDKATFTARNIKDSYSFGKLLFHEGLGVQSLLFILPAALFACPINLIRNKNKDIFLNYIMLLPFLLYLSYRFVLPIANSRYFYPGLGVGMITAFYMIYSLRVPARIVRIAVIISLLVSASECARRAELGIALVLSLLISAVFIFMPRRDNLIVILFSKKIIIFILGGLLIALQLLLPIYEKNEYVGYVKNSRYWPDATKAWLWLNNNTTGNNIAYIGKPMPYPLYGWRFKNNVYYASVNAIDPARMHDFKSSKYSWGASAITMHKSFEQQNNYRGNADYATWKKNLTKRHTDYLFVYSLHHVEDVMFPIEDDWARSHSKEFDLAFSNASVRIYKLKKI